MSGHGHRGGESSALRSTRYFCLRRLEQRPALRGLLLLVVQLGSGASFAGPRETEWPASAVAVDDRLPLPFEKEERRGHHRRSLLKLVRTGSEVGVDEGGCACAFGVETGRFDDRAVQRR